MIIENVGYGVESLRLPDRLHLLRLIMGRSTSEVRRVSCCPDAELSCHLNRWG